MEETLGSTSDSANLRVVQLAAGEAHTLALTATGSVYAWGRGFFGRLGTGKEMDELVPVRISLINEKDSTASTLRDCGNKDMQVKCLEEDQKALCVVRVAAGAYHSLALSDCGDVWSWGYNDYGQLGRNVMNGSIPAPVSFPSYDKVEHEKLFALRSDAADDVHSCPIKVVDVAAGGMMSCAIDQTGGLWMWGHCPNALSDDECNSTLLLVEAPMPLKGLEKYHISRVACGNEHVVALAESGSALFSWGNNSHGQLGLGDTKNRSYPQVIDAILSRGHPSDISCGAFHSAVLVSSQAAEHACWTFGEGENGQLGHGTSARSLVPVLMEGLPKEKNWVRVACGLFHSAVVSETGEVWICGMQRGLGLLPGIDPLQYMHGDALVPYKFFEENLVGESLPLNPRELACGAAHTVTSAHGGSRIFSWGRGQNGVLGTGQLDDSWAPCPVVWPPLDQSSDPQSSKFILKDNMNDIEDINCKQTTNFEETKNEMDIRLASALEENFALKRELEYFKDRARSLYFAVYGGVRKVHEQYMENFPIVDAAQPSSSHLPISEDTAAQEWQRTIHAANYADLLKYESFYKAMHSQVEDMLLQKKVENWCKLYMGNLSVPKASTSHAHGGSSQHNLAGNINRSMPSNLESYADEELQNLVMRLKKL